MDAQRAKLGAAFTGVALLGVGLGFAVSARLDVPGTSSAEAAPLTQPANANLPADSRPATPPPIATTPAPPAPPAGSLAAGPTGSSFAPLVKQVGPSVVHISVGKRMGQGVGTGFVISPDGYILTNEHVVGGSSRVQVKFPDDSELQAELVGTDPNTDLALIKVDPPGPLPTLVLGDSDALEVGDWVIAIGSPLGLDHTVTAGIVSAKQRRGIAPGGRVAMYEDFIQTDASINPGNSGGPLLNVRGEVVGINSAVSTQGQGIGFAIPINMAKTLLPQLQTTGHVERSWLGISIGPVRPDYASKVGLADTRGALVADIVPGGPAEKAGLERGEIILAFDSKMIDKPDELRWLASVAGIGKKVNVLVHGPKGQRTVQVTLEKLRVQ
jgi:serine protease Do